MKLNTLFAFISNLGLKKIFKSFQIDLSLQFMSCADNQLSNLYFEITSLKIDNRTWIGPVEKEDFFYQVGIVSKIPFLLYLPFIGRINVIICWQSKSGRIYNISDEDIDCADIEFWFENLDVELCRKASNPRWSLIPEIYQPGIIERLKKWNVECSASFISCLDKQLSGVFEKKTGIKMSKRIRMHLNERNLNLSYGNTSSMNVVLTIVEEQPNDLIVCWKSRSGCIYRINDEDINCDDIEFWFENFQAEVYIKQYYPNQQLPFKIKDISFELIVNRINLDCTIELTLKEEEIHHSEKIVHNIDQFIADFNDKSEKRNRNDGVIHNWNTQILDDKLVYNIDLGSTGISFFKKLLGFLSKLNVFLKVEIV